MVQYILANYRKTEEGGNHVSNCHDEKRPGYTAPLTMQGSVTYGNTIAASKSYERTLLRLMKTYVKGTGETTPKPEDTAYIEHFIKDKGLTTDWE
ncbi:MAG: hypothetical protein RR288_07625, partial [Oscillibacter sp.]